ncbi:MAG TPA: hypothetical protein VHM64_04955 [Candidatus Binatia bacterium]|nr:hypothetical protein [Candidatus Binatia bacterium]
MPSAKVRYGASLELAGHDHDAAAPIESAADLLARTVECLARRAPSIAADAARELGTIVLGLHSATGATPQCEPD